MLAISAPGTRGQRVPQPDRRDPDVVRRSQRLPNNQRRIDRVPLGIPQPGGRPGAAIRQARKRELQQRLMRAIGLTREQYMRMQDIRRSHDDDVIAAGRRLRLARRSLDQTIMSERYDESAVRRATDELVAAQADKVRIESKIRSEVRGVLTADQVVKFHELQRQIRREMRQQNLQQRNEQLDDPAATPSSRPPGGLDEDQLIDVLLWADSAPS